MKAGRPMTGFGVAVVRGRSMESTLRDGDRVLVAYGWRPRDGAVVLVRLPGRGLAVKRLLQRVPDGWWVERDNPAEGVDSWLVGPVAEADLLGVAVLRLWPRPGLLRRRPT